MFHHEVAFSGTQEPFKAIIYPLGSHPYRPRDRVFLRDYQVQAALVT